MTLIFKIPELHFHGEDTNSITHRIHPYGAKFPPQIPYWAITEFSNPGDVVLDPFCGGGTTLVEARRNGRIAWGTDIDPLAILISKVKATPIDPTLLDQSITSITQTIENDFRALKEKRRYIIRKGKPSQSFTIDSRSIKLPVFDNRDYWFDPFISCGLALLCSRIQTVENEAIRQFLQVVVSSCIIARTSVANMRDVVHTRPHKYIHTIVPDLKSAFCKKLSVAVRAIKQFSAECVDSADTRIVGGDARRLNSIPPASVDLIVTSPPYINALDYPRAHKFALYWLGIKPLTYQESNKAAIGLPRRSIQRWPILKDQPCPIIALPPIISMIEQESIEQASIVKDYFLDMDQALGEMYRVLRPAGMVCLVIASSTIRGIQINTPYLLAGIAESHGFIHRASCDRTLDHAKRCLPFQSPSLENRMQHEKVIVMQKPG